MLSGQSALGGLPRNPAGGNIHGVGQFRFQIFLQGFQFLGVQFPVRKNLPALQHPGVHLHITHLGGQARAVAPGRVLIDHAKQRLCLTHLPRCGFHARISGKHAVKPPHRRAYVADQLLNHVFLQVRGRIQAVIHQGKGHRRNGSPRIHLSPVVEAQPHVIDIDNMRTRW